MGLGQNIITDLSNRLQTSIGNWYALPVELTAGFAWVGDKADIFTDLYLEIITGNLAKDYFTALQLSAVYQTDFDYYWPSTSPEGSVDFEIDSDTVQAVSVSFDSSITDAWKHLTNLSVVDPAFDNTTRIIRFSLNAINPGDYHVFIKNLSVRKSTEAKTDHLPLIGVH